MERAGDDWQGTKVGFHLQRGADNTFVRFHHTGWPAINEHYRISCHCWAMYLRVLRRYLSMANASPMTTVSTSDRGRCGMFRDPVFRRT